MSEKSFHRAEELFRLNSVCAWYFLFSLVFRTKWNVSNFLPQFCPSSSTFKYAQTNWAHNLAPFRLIIPNLNCEEWSNHKFRFSLAFIWRERNTLPFKFIPQSRVINTFISHPSSHKACQEVLFSAAKSIHWNCFRIVYCDKYEIKWGDFRSILEMEINKDNIHLLFTLLLPALSITPLALFTRWNCPCNKTSAKFIVAVQRAISIATHARNVIA